MLNYNRYKNNLTKATEQMALYTHIPKTKSHPN